MKTSTPIIAVAATLLLTTIAVAQCVGGICRPIDPWAGERSTAPALDSRPSTLDSLPHCRVLVGDGSVGSATLVARNDTTGLVLTCSHLFDQSASSIVVVCADGGRYRARLIDRDPANDLAALLIKRPSVEPLTVNDDVPTGVLTACGYGGNGSFRPVTGPIVGAVQAVGATHPTVKFRGAVRPGDSGGGVLDSAGRLVGVVWGCRDGETYVTCGRPLREFLDRVWQGRRSRCTAGSAATDSTPSDLAAWRAQVDRRLASLDTNKQDKGDYLTADELAAYAKQAEIPAVEHRVELRVRALLSALERQIAAASPGLVDGLGYGKLIAGALGVGGPLALAVMIAGGLAGRRRKAQRDSNLDPASAALRRPQPNSPTTVPVAVDSPPPPQQTVPETHYVPVQRDDYARAHQWASEQVARKYPGSTEMLAALDSLIKQQLAATN